MGSTKQQAKFFGSFDRQSTERVAKISFNHDGTLLACQAADPTIEIYSIASLEQLSKKLKKRKKKAQKKAQEENAEIHEPTIHQVTDEYSLQQIVRTSSKIHSFSFANQSNQV